MKIPVLKPLRESRTISTWLRFAKLKAMLLSRLLDSVLITRVLVNLALARDLFVLSILMPKGYSVITVEEISTM